jgi:hypothetical protein
MTGMSRWLRGGGGISASKSTTSIRGLPRKFLYLQFHKISNIKFSPRETRLRLVGSVR